MRTYQEGFELDEDVSTELSPTLPLLPIAGWVGAGGSEAFISTVTPHRNTKGFGGSQSLSMALVVFEIRRNFYGPKLPLNLPYGCIGFAARTPDELDSKFGISVIEGGFEPTAKQVSVVISFSGTVGLQVGGTNVANGSTIFSNGWHWYVLEYFCHPTSGFMNLYVDGVLEIATGLINTRGFSGADYFNQVQMYFGSNSQLDDIVINTPTISYSSGSGTPTVGTTVTGATSLSTAVISGYREYSPGVGFLILSPSIGSTSGPYGFEFGETLNASGWSATANQKDIDSNGLDINSGIPKENFLLLLRPTSDVSVQLTGSDSDQVDNFANVNEVPFGTTTNFNEGDVSGLADIYSMQNLPFSPESVEAVEVVVYATRSGDISGVEPGIDPGLGVTYGDIKLVGSGGTYAKGSHIFDVNPDTGDAWTESDVNSSDIAVRLA